MERPRIRHIAINVQDREKEAEYYKQVFGMEEKDRGANGTIYLSDGFVDLALIHSPNLPWGIHHFGFQVPSVAEVEQLTGTTAVQNPATLGRHAEFVIRDPEGNHVDLSEHGWPV
ncbi:MAG: VOC family protein [Deltaproteobacteria bacterium]|nr:VOC family protein [Deltaproteobacteria bacterium]